jgi:hypothetical protein
MAFVTAIPLPYYCQDCLLHRTRGHDKVISITPSSAVIIVPSNIQLQDRWLGPSRMTPKVCHPSFHWPPLALASPQLRATLLTWYAAHYRQLGHILASSSVTLVTSLMVPGLGQAAMCGSFAGMSSAQVLLLPNWQTVTALGLLTSALFEG